MSKPSKPRTSTSGQYVSPLLNELEWLDEEIEEKPAAAKKNPQIRKSPKKAQMKKKKSGPPAKINGQTPQSSQPASHPLRRSAPSASPLILLDRPKPRYPKASWVKELFGIDRWTVPNDDSFAKAIQSFQLGLDGILKSGEELLLLPPRRKPIVIDVSPQSEEAEADDTVAEPETMEYVTETDSSAGLTGPSRELQQYGLIPFQFQPFDDWIEITVTFAEPFAADQYALVATTDQPGCRSVIEKKEPNAAVVRLLRESLSPHLGGELNWIAIGEGTAVVPTGTSH